ncbi:hypothetical protein AYO44_02130 [Planctomycetaceae bacterium SCGC AG-212-F19]|nr:hypothetical protein AYO44_02130 [Planctomycetaceae bacterium SCGC AG-212-F19]
MRAGPLSNPKVIALLNGYFVCAYTSNDDIPGDADTVGRERKERERIKAAFREVKLGSGEVSPYILTPDAKPLGRLSIGPACEKDNLLQLLEKIVAEQKLARGDPIVKPAPQAPQPDSPADALVLHLVARKLTPKYSWNEFPSEDWIVLNRDAWEKLLPPGGIKVKESYPLDRDAAAVLLTRFFPQTEVCTAKPEHLLAADGKYRHRLEQHELRGTVLSVQDGTARVRLDGSLKLYHKFYPGHEDQNMVNATVVGYLDFDMAKKKVTALRLVTDQATYVKTPIGVALRSVP